MLPASSTLTVYQDELTPTSSSQSLLLPLSTPHTGTPACHLSTAPWVSSLLFHVPPRCLVSKVHIRSRINFIDNFIFSYFCFFLCESFSVCSECFVFLHTRIYVWLSCALLVLVVCFVTCVHECLSPNLFSPSHTP